MTFESKLVLRCPDCVSRDIKVIVITIDGISGKFYHCNECGFEWAAPDDAE